MNKIGICRGIPKPHAQAPGATEPAILFIRRKRALLNITTAAVDNIASSDSIPLKALPVLTGDSCDSFRLNPLN